MEVFVVSKHGDRLMPTRRLGKVRHMLKDGRAVIYKRRPFTIKLTYEITVYTQPMELCMDTGYQHIGVSVKSDTREHASEQYDLLIDEKERHDSQRRLRRTRRNRKRYRAPRFNNRRASKKDGWLAPSLRNKAGRHVDIIAMYAAVAPITDVYLEVVEFDTQLLKAIQEGSPIPQGEDYQRGLRYGHATLRAAVIHRDGHKCLFCGRGLKNGAVLHVHHVYFWRGQHGDSMDELATCCEKCHTPTNHQPGGKLWGYDKKLPRYTGAAFMNTIRWYIYQTAKVNLPGIRLHLTYGTATRLARQDLNLEKSHVNDAYAMGKLHPAERAAMRLWQKRRRNNRCLEKFYDAKYIDTRDGRRKSGANLGCQRTNRREPRMSSKNLRIYHGKKITKGRRSIRRQRYQIQPGDIILWAGERYLSKGCHNNGSRVLLQTNKSVSVSKVQVICHSNGWLQK